MAIVHDYTKGKERHYMSKPLEGEEQIRHYYRKIKELRDNFSDIIPSEAIHSTSPNNRFKCRKAWWAVMNSRLADLEDIRVLPQEVVRRYHEIYEKYVAVVDKDVMGVKPENIREANELLSEVLDTLEARLGPNPN